MALAVALFALVIIGILVSGTLFSGRLEQQSGSNTIYGSQAAEAAEAGLSDAVGTTTAPTILPLAVGGAPLDLGTVSLGGRVDATREVTRLTSSLFLIRSNGTRRNAAGGPLASRSAGTLVRLITPTLLVRGGLSAIGQTTITGNATVSGIDTTPPVWKTVPGMDCPPESDMPGVVYNGSLSQTGSSVVTGNPPKLADPTMNPSNQLGGTTFEQLKQLATLTIATSSLSGLAAAVTNGVPPTCNPLVQNNWGAPTDPNSPCFTYFPIIYRQGNLHLSGQGVGQGILLVEGNLEVQGQISFYGPVIATGSVDVRGTGTDDVKFYGGIIASDVKLDDSKLSGNATVLYSSCANRRALLNSAVVTRLAQRGWLPVN